VLVVDQARFPSDTISTHPIHPPVVAALKEWGLLDRLVAARAGAGVRRPLSLITALGISTAFRDAGLCARALDQLFAGAGPFEDAMAAYHFERDRHSLPFYEFTTELATLQPLPPELERVLDAVHGD
jgi:hypothetical protein